MDPRSPLRWRSLKWLGMLAGGIAIAGCTSTPNPPLIFGQSQTLGVTIAGTPATGGGEFSVGYRDYNVAVVPVTVTQAEGDTTWLGASAGGGFEDAFSTLGQFDAQVNSGTSGPSVGLGKFFATGIAAQKLADGFASKLAK